MRFSDLLLVGVLALAGCSEQGVSFDGSYSLTDIDGAKIGGDATLVIEGAQLAGQAPCNNYRGENQAEWPQISLTPVAVTRKLCQADQGEALFLQALGQITMAERTEDGCWC